MTRRTAAAVLSTTTIIVIVLGGVRASTADATDTAVSRGAAYLATRQGADGSVPDTWRPDQVAESVIALLAGGGQQATVDRAITFLAHEGAAGASSGPYAGRIVAGLVAAGKDPRQFAGTDFVARTSFYYNGAGSYGGNLYGDALAMLGLLAAHVPPPSAAITRLQVNQCRDGGWSYQLGCAGQPDTDTTSMVMSVLAASMTTGARSAEVQKGRAWLLAQQRASGCWGHDPGSPDNANSCGLAMSAIVAIGESPNASPWTDNGRDPASALRDLQLPSGGFQFRKDVSGENDYATIQAIPGIAGWSYPVHEPAAGSSSGSGATSTTPTGGGSDGGASPTPATGGATTSAPASKARRPAPAWWATTTTTSGAATTGSTSARASRSDRDRARASAAATTATAAEPGATMTGDPGTGSLVARVSGAHDRRPADRHDTTTSWWWWGVPVTVAGAGAAGWFGRRRWLSRTSRPAGQPPVP